MLFRSRIIVGNVDAVARGKESLDWLEALLAGDERSRSAVTAPACGLYFWRAGYRELPDGGTLGRDGFWGGSLGSPDGREWILAAQMMLKSLRTA